MTRWILVDWETRTVSADAYFSRRDAWNEIVKLATQQNRSPYEWDLVSVEVEAK